MQSQCSLRQRNKLAEKTELAIGAYLSAGLSVCVARAIVAMHCERGNMPGAHFAWEHSFRFKARQWQHNTPRLSIHQFRPDNKATTEAWRGRAFFMVDRVAGQGSVCSQSLATEAAHTGEIELIFRINKHN